MTGNEIELEILREESLNRMGDEEKVSRIMNSVRNNKIVVLEGGLTSEEEARVVERVMELIDGEDFTGIEIESHRSTSEDSGLMDRFLNRDEGQDSLTIVGPEGTLESIDKNDSTISTMISLRRGV